MDIVDCQVHLGPGGAAKMVSAMNALGIQSALIDEYWMGTPGEPAYRVGGGVARATSPTAELAAWKYPDRFAYVVRLDRRDPALRAITRLTRDASHARGLRILVGTSRAETAAFARGEYEHVFSAAMESGLPLFVAISGFTDLLEPYLKKFPDLRVVVDHCGMPPSSAIRAVLAKMEALPDSDEFWKGMGDRPLRESLGQVLTLARYPNVAIKWAHPSAIFEVPNYPNAGLRAYLRQVLDIFGAGRVMWASDFTTLPTGETWAQVLFSVINNPDLSAEEREGLLGKTARTWLDWKVSGERSQPP